MTNERITENIVRNHLQQDTLFKENKVIVEEQSSQNIKIDKLLKNASKSGGGKGYPEFIIQYNENANLIIVVECKADIAKHESQEGRQYKDYAVDGVLLYASFLAKEYDVIAVAVSGNNRNKRISHFLQLKGDQAAHKIFNNDRFLNLEDYLNGYQTDERKFNQDFQELLKYSKTLNDKLHSLKVKESERSLLISGTLIALTDSAFSASYKLENPQTLANLLVNKINEKLSSVQTQHVKDIISSYNFIKTHTILAKQENKLKEIIDEIDEKINNFHKTYEYFDTLGQFYIEFLRYANNDKGLGIVLTPHHITELFCEIANVNKDSVVLDTCTGTGGFLIASMQKMIIDAGGDAKKKKQIKEKQIVGVELQHDIYSLLCSNMYIHRDGRSNLMKGSCFDKDIKNQLSKFKPNVGFLNPPYKINKNDREEWEFVLNNLEQLEKGSYCVAIIPMSCAMADQDKIQTDLKKKILQAHTLEAVFSMPNELFHNSKVSVATCICVFKAKEKHPDGYKTYFGIWTNDGFIKIKNTGRTDYHDAWNAIKEKWLRNYKNKDDIAGHSIKKVVEYNSEWCSEAFITIRYSDITKPDFENCVRKYVNSLFSIRKIDGIERGSVSRAAPGDIQEQQFKYFDLTGGRGIFDITKGERINKVERKSGLTPLLTSTSLNNGISEFIDKDFFIDNKELFSDKITIDMLSNVFYHGYDYFSDDNVHTLTFKDKYIKFDNVFVCIFIATLMQKIKIRYQYGRQVRLKRLRTEQIALPVDKKGNPDWRFMEDYIKSLPYSSNL